MINRTPLHFEICFSFFSKVTCFLSFWDGEKLATVDGRNLYKVPATGRMTTANVISTCKSIGMDAACESSRYADSKCTLVNSDNDILFGMDDFICNGHGKT